LETLHEDNCEVMKAMYAVYSVPEAAALWCGIKEENVGEILANAAAISRTGPGRGIFTHPYVSCLEPRTRAITEAIESGDLPHGREDGSTVASGEHVAYERRHIRGRDLKSWMEKALPNEKPAFLFDDIERSSHTAISRGAYQTLQAEHDRLKTRLVNAKAEFKKLRQEKESVESERDSLRKIADSIKNQPSGSTKTSTITQSEYWSNFTETASRAVDEFPVWRDSQRQVQKTGNLMDWLTNTLGVDNREAEVLKKVLSDFFIELR
jgi:hypothetical protein